MLSTGLLTTNLRPTDNLMWLVLNLPSYVCYTIGYIVYIPQPYLSHTYPNVDKQSLLTLPVLNV
jgi:hypothetical protein